MEMNTEIGLILVLNLHFYFFFASESLKSIVQMEQGDNSYERNKSSIIAFHS